MKKIMIKAASAVLVAAMILPIASCGRKKTNSHGGRLIEEDSPWFEARTLEIDTGVKEDREKEYTYSELAGFDDEKMIIYTQGNYKMPANFNWETGNYSDFMISTLAVVDRATGTTTKVYDLQDLVDENDYPERAVYSDGKLTVTANSFDAKTYGVIYKEYDIDLETGKATDIRVNDNQDQVTGIFNVGDYVIKAAANWNSDITYYTLYITGPDGEEKKVELKDSKKDIYSVDAVIPMTETTALIPASVSVGFDFYELDLTTGQITKQDSKEYDWLSDVSLYAIFVGSDGNIYSTTPMGISRIDMEKKTVEEVFNYSWCGISRNALANLQLADISDDKFLLFGEEYSNAPFTQMYDWNNAKFQIIEFTKAEKNPHAGKRVLELYSSYGYTDDPLSKAISEFNETNNKYFIEVTDRYSNSASSVYDDIKDDDDMDRQTNEYFAAMTNQLSMDIINGEGPDMFLDVSHLDQLNNGDYLADLTPYVGKLDSNKYFTNILDIAKVDGKLYNLPVCFGIDGIHTDAKYAGTTGVGFTTDEYIEFLSGALNGTDVITNGQAYYFVTLFNAMNDEFIKNGKVDFSGPEFAALAEYVKDNVPEQAKSWESENEGYIINSADMFHNTKPAIYTTSFGFSDYFQTLEQLESGNSILGIPSSDGRGPTASPYTSIAISAQAYDIDACGDFVKLLLSDSIQKEYATMGNFVLNRELFRETGEGAVNYFNSISISNMYGGYYGEDIPDNRVKYTTEHIDILENLILNCSAMWSEDAEINNILIEEMPSYFSGQKELDKVIEIAQDRVQKVLNERG